MGDKNAWNGLCMNNDTFMLLYRLHSSKY